MISRNTLKRDSLNIYDHEREKTIMKIKNNPITKREPSWLSRHITLMTLRIWKARFINVPSPHTQEVFFDVLLDCMFDWNVDRRCFLRLRKRGSTYDCIRMIGRQ
ncbi:hypothetical protein ACSBR1_038999 [Camellia fascicularis]